MRHLIVIILLYSFLSACNYWTSETREFTYSDLVKIFAISQYVKDYKRIEEELVQGYNIDKISNQKQYSSLLSSKVDTQEKWNKFLKDTIDYYILFRKSGEQLKISYYKDGAYNEKLKFFDSNYLIDMDAKALTSRYWRVEESQGKYIKSKKSYRMLLFSKEYNMSSHVQERFYYDESKYVLKKEFFGEGGKLKKKQYYYYNKEIL